jgi:hypothetical protein
MKKIFLIIWILISIVPINNKIFSEPQTRSYRIEGAGDYTYEQTYIVCDDVACVVACHNPGSRNCTIDAESLNDPRSCGCLLDRALFSESDGTDMFDYANNQIANSNYLGIYYANILKPDGTIFYRTVTWEYDTTAHTRNVTYDVTKVPFTP